jgi:minor histocompatibility antigen H13
MVYVATSFEAPIKLLMPKFFFTTPGEMDRPFTMLGLGDIVIPGMVSPLMSHVK